MPRSNAQRRWITTAFGLGATLMILATIFQPPASTALAAADLPIYTDSLASGWQDWSWGGNYNFNNASPRHSGTASISTAYTAAWGGLYLHTDSALPAADYTAIRFWVHGGSSGGQLVRLGLNNGGDTYAFTPQANTWVSVTVPLSALDNPTTLTDLVWQDTSGHAQSAFYLDDITLIGTSGPPPTTPPPGVGPALSVNAGADQHAISPYIYGMNFADETLAAELRLPVRRWGGNSTSRYNWQNDTTNTGSDWYFENVPEENNAADNFVEQDQRTGTQTLLTMPLIGWVAKSRPTGHPYDCGFKISLYGAQQDADWAWDADCGNGVRTNGTEITGNNPTDTSTAVTSAFATGWVNHLVSQYGTAANGGVKFYNLDNEPMLWNSTHRDVHPNPTTYDELRDKTYAYAAAIKAADPSAQTLGPVVWGWCAYFYSAADGCAPGPDHAAHGNMDFVEWYLQQMRAYEQAHGTRILDYVDVHIYPQVDGVYGDSQGSSTVQAARLRSTRQLWDRTYVHEGWIGQPVYLIPRMKEWVTNNYTGTKLAITEYNWGALGYMNGALAQADILGIFGREGLDLATLWGPPTASQPGAYAFRMYLNYDGGHSQFGDTSVRAASTHQEQLAIYAAKRTTDQALTLMIINKTGQPLTSAVTLSNFTPQSMAVVYRYSTANLNAIVRQADQAVTASGFSATFPANSITLVILPQAVQPDLSASSKTASLPVADQGDVLTYTLHIVNQGLPLTGTVLLTDTIPAGLAYVPGSLTATAGAVDDTAAPTLYWSGMPPAAQDVTVHYAVTVTTSSTEQITNLAQIAYLGQTPLTRTASMIANGFSVYLPLVAAP